MPNTETHEEFRDRKLHNLLVVVGRTRTLLEELTDTIVRLQNNKDAHIAFIELDANNVVNRAVELLTDCATLTAIDRERRDV